MYEPVEKGFRDLMTGVVDAYQNELISLYIQLECIRDSLKDLECKRLAKRVHFIANRLQEMALQDIPLMVEDPIEFAKSFDNIEAINILEEMRTKESNQNLELLVNTEPNEKH